MQTPNQHIIWQHSSHMFVCKGCGKKLKTNNSINRSKKLFHFKLHHRKSFCNFSMWGKGEGEEKDVSVQLQEEGKHPLQSKLEIYYLLLSYTQLCNVYFFRLHVRSKIIINVAIQRFTIILFIMHKIFIFEIPVRRKMLGVSSTNNILIIQP